MTIEPLASLDPDAPVVLEMSHISKSFGAVTALVDVSIKLRQGEVLALVGDNGAGKSTLIKILSGFHQPDAGAIALKGKPVRFSSPREARAEGIETVYQDLAMIGDLSVPGPGIPQALSRIEPARQRQDARPGGDLPRHPRHFDSERECDGRPALGRAAPMYRGGAIDLCVSVDPGA
jgi:ABC transporter